MEKIILLKNERNAVDYLKGVMTEKNVPIQIYRARPCKGIGANRSVYLYKWNDQSGWIQGQKFWGDNHQERCDVAISELRNHSKELSDDNFYFYCYQEDTN